MIKKRILEVGPGRYPFIESRIALDDYSINPAEIIYEAIDLFNGWFGTVAEIRKKLSLIPNLDFIIHPPSNMFRSLPKLKSDYYDEIHFHKILDLHWDIFQKFLRDQDNGQFLYSIRRLCKLKGRVIISDPRFSPNPFHDNHSSVEGYSRAFQKIGFDETERIEGPPYRDIGYGTGCQSLIKLTKR